ncbi:MAG: aquaporin family protein [Gemmatimonadaceae bacterium]|jgi:glycerol uptake facilitator protein|nr:aquaporin family protein [Gemmatimonadaceae bacterium]
MPPTALGEFLGTAILILLGNGVVAGVLLEESKSRNAGWIVITAGWAVAVLSGVLTAVALGAPGELNPAVSLAAVVLGTRSMSEAIWHIAAQFAGAMAGATLVWLHYLPHWAATPDAGRILACHCTAPAIRRTLPNLVSEIIGTAVLVLVATTIGSAAVAGATPATNLGPLLVAALVWGIGLSLGGPTGYAINPARDLGPRLAHAILPIANKGSSDWSYAWIPVLGPVIGGMGAAWLWSALRP